MTAPAMKSAPLLAALLASACAPSATLQPARGAPPAAPAWDAGLSERVETLRAEWRVPGAAVVVVGSEGERYAAASGVRDSATAAPFAVDTLFPLASISKTWTAVALGRLVDQGRVRWDDPVVLHDPTFTLADPEHARRITLRDLLAHRSGLGAHAMDAYVMPRLMRGERCVRAELLAWARTLAPAHGLREQEAYSNLGYIELGVVIERITGKPWPEAMRALLVEPLELTHTVLGEEAYLARADHALPHELDPEGRVAPSAFIESGDCLYGAGGVYASARDLGTFARMLLAGGTHAGRRILARATVDELLAPHMEMAPSAFLERTHGTASRARTLGWEVTRYHGETLVRMGGLGAGFQSAVMLLPERDVAVTVLQNFCPALLHVSLSYELIDRLLGRPTRDWSAVYREVLPRVPERGAAPLDPARLDAFVGAYACDGFPRRIVREGDALYLLGTSPLGGGPPLIGRARLFGLGTEGTLFIKTDDAVFRFTRDAAGRIDGFVETWAGAEHHFVRVP